MSNLINIKSEKELEYMRVACKITALIHKTVAEAIKPGITTKELDIIAENVIRSNGAIPSFKGQIGQNNSRFPACICISVNDEIIHGIPGKRVLQEGDIVSIDAGACYKGYHGDAARTVAVGKISKEAQKLIDITKQSFFEGIELAVEGNRISDISHAIQTYVEKNGFSVVKEYEGHGVGRSLHEAPEIPNFGKAGHGPRLQKGMTLAIEPMVNAGSEEIELDDNDWTVYTYDGKLSAHYENTILITDNKPEILTI